MQPINPLTKTMVFEGNELSRTVPVNNSQQARCAIRGQDASGKPASFFLSDDLLSKHLLFIGGIGMGKTNGIFQILSQLRNNMTSDDVMVVFDTKGDFYDSFYRQGDIVISNDEKATGPRGKDYWNIFEEINAGITTEEEIVEIARALFLNEVTSRVSLSFQMLPVIFFWDHAALSPNGWCKEQCGFAQFSGPDTLC